MKKTNRSRVSAVKLHSIEAPAVILYSEYMEKVRCLAEVVFYAWYIGNLLEPWMTVNLLLFNIWRHLGLIIVKKAKQILACIWWFLQNTLHKKHILEDYRYFYTTLQSLCWIVVKLEGTCSKWVLSLLWSAGTHCGAFVQPWYQCLTTEMNEAQLKSRPHTEPCSGYHSLLLL